MFLENKQPQDQKNKPHEEHEDRNAIDPMHIPHPLRIRRIRIPLLNVKIFGYLPPDSHNIIGLLSKDK
jgi:hypothetical protein